MQVRGTVRTSASATHHSHSRIDGDGKKGNNGELSGGFKVKMSESLLTSAATSKEKTIMFPGHMTVSEVMVCSSLSGLVGRPDMDMKDYW